jgi:hypothetical protein
MADKTFNDLIKFNSKQAAEKFVDAMRFLVNSYVPKMYMNKDEFKVVWDKEVADPETVHETLLNNEEFINRVAQAANTSGYVPLTDSEIRTKVDNAWNNQ